MNRNKTRSVVDGALIAALFGVFSIFNTYTGGLIDIILCYIMVVPLAWYGYKYSLKENIIVAIVSMIIVVLFGVPYFIISSVASCLSGLFLGECLKKEYSKQTMMLGTLVISIINNILIYEVFNGLLGIDLVSEVEEFYNTLTNMININISLSTMLSLIPLVIIITSVLEMYVILLICQVIFYRLRIKFPNDFHISSLHFSKKVGVILTLGVLLGVVSTHLMGYSNIIIQYIYLICMFAFMVEGFAFGNYYCIISHKPIYILILFLIFIIPYGIYIYILLGFIDIFSDLRVKVLYNKQRVRRDLHD